MQYGGFSMLVLTLMDLVIQMYKDANSTSSKYGGLTFVDVKGLMDLVTQYTGC